MIPDLNHCYRHIAIYVAPRAYTILGRMCLLRDLHFTLLYVVVSQQFDKHLYLTSYINARNHNTCIHLAQNMVNCAKDIGQALQKEYVNTRLDMVTVRLSETIKRNNMFTFANRLDL